LTPRAAGPRLRRPMACRSLLPSLALVAAACTTPVQVPPAGGVFEGHPWGVARADLRVEARYYVDQARIFGGDLAEDHRLLPVALRLGRAEGVLEGPVALPDDMQFTLHLADGTSLGRVPPASADVRRRRLERLLAEGFTGGVLEPWERAEEGFLYFALPPRLHFDSDSLRVVERLAGGTRSLDLRASLLTFEVVGTEGPRTVSVGLAIDRRGARGE
jgi:hypothetical protein